MVSAIDPTKPIDGVPAEKTDLRDNLAAAKSEIEALQAGTGLANDAVTLAKIQNAAASSKLLGSGSAGAGANYTEITLDSTLTMTGTTLAAAPGAVADNSITNAKLRDSGALSVVGRSANSTGDPADIAAAAASGAVLRESGSALGFGTVATAGLADGAVTYAKMQDVSAASRLLGRGSAAGAGDPQEITISTGLTLTGTVLTASGAGASTFDALTDTPSSKVGQGGKYVRVNAGGTALEYDPAGVGGTAPGTTYTAGVSGAVARTVQLALDDGPISIKEFGAVGNGVADDTAALQAAMLSNRRIWFPSGRYAVTAPLEYTSGFYWEGECGANTSDGGATPFVEIFSSFGPEPMIHPRGVWMGIDGVAHIDGDAVRNLNFITLENLRLSNTHVDGQVAYLRYLIAPSKIIGCTIAGARRGLSVTSFDAVIQACRFSGHTNATISLTDHTDIERSWALAVGGEVTVTGCFFQGGATGLAMSGRGCNASNLRFETRPLAVLLGVANYNDDGLNDGQTQASDAQWYDSYIRGVKFEANDRDIVLRKVGPGAIIEDMISQGSTGSPSGLSQRSVEIRSGESRTTIRNYAAGGQFRGPVILNKWPLINLQNFGGGGASVTADSTGQACIFNPRLANPTETHYQHISAPNDDGWNTGTLHGRQQNKSITIFHNMQHRGLKGLNLTKKTVQPNNFGDLVAVANGVTTHAVVFAPALVGPRFSTFAAVADGASTLAAGTYHYAVAGVWKNGENGIGTSLGGLAWQSKVVTAGQKVQITIAGSANPPYVRVYRSIVGGGNDDWGGFWHLPRFFGTFEDTGQAFDGEGGPVPLDIGPISSQEDDADYAVVATPSWGTTCWITAKATTGFTLNFGTASPDANQTVQWLLFRP